MAVAFSGGRDSTALLHATLMAAAPLGMRVLALHVHHGLSANADAWQRHGERLCARWARRGLPLQFAAKRIALRPPRGASVEAWARQVRYQALRQMALDRGCDLVLLAQHRRDQAETFLLQALRGGAVAALSAMPALVCRDGITWARPWLQQPREAVEAYLRRYRLKYIDDDTNGDRRFARNRLRTEVWPALEAAFPNVEAALSSAARRAGEAAAVLDGWARADLESIASQGRLDIAAWRALPTERQGDALRAWLRQRLGRGAPASLSVRLASELDERAAKRWPVPGGELHSYRGRLSFGPTGATAPMAPSSLPLAADLSQPGVHEIAPWRGAFVIERAESDGLPLATAARSTLRARRPGDRFQADPTRPPRSLKLQYQAAGVPAWQRDGPLACDGDVPVFVPGLGIDARARAAEGEPQVRLAWRPVFG